MSMVVNGPDSGAGGNAAPGPEGRPGRGGAGRRGAFAIFAFSARSMQQIASLVITLLAAGFLVPAEYGVYTLAIVFVTLIQVLTYTGFYHFVVTSKEPDREVLSTSFWMITGLATGSAVLLALAAIPIGWLYDAPELGSVILWLAAIQPVAGMGAWYSAALLRRQAMGAHFGIMFAQNVVALVGGAALLWLWQSLYALVAFRYLRVLTGFALYVAVSRDRPSFRFDRALARRATGFSGGLYGSQFLNFLSRYSGDLLLGLLFTTAEAGLYRFGSRLANAAIEVVLQPMLNFALSQFGAANRADRDLEGPLARFAGVIVLLCGAVAAVIVVLGAELTEAFFDPAYLAGIVVAYAMGLRGMASVGSTLITPTLSARDRTGHLMAFSSAVAAVSVAAVAMSAPFGIAALAWTEAAVGLAASAGAFWMIRRHGGVSVGPAVAASFKSAGLAAIYGATIWGSWPLVAEAAGLEGAAGVMLGLAWAMVLFGPLLWLGRRVGVFTLSVFNG
jgi:O-antigen/teichoic acid export membrane protein